MIIDSHHHFWKYDPVEYDWINDQMEVIRKDFVPADLEKTINDAGVAGVVSVQARQSVDETEWLLKLAGENEFIYGVVGWLPLADERIGEFLDKYSGNDKLKALRHVVQDEPNPEFLLGRKFNEGISLLKSYNLTYDILILENQLTEAVRFADRHPDQLFVLDHIAKPKIKERLMDPWKQNITELAKRNNIYCKISGMVTEADMCQWSEADLLPYFDHVLHSFGPGRLLFGSDWPVCLTAISYGDWLGLVKKWLSGLSEHEQKQIFFKNSINVYGLKFI